MSFVTRGISTPGPLLVTGGLGIRQLQGIVNQRFLEGKDEDISLKGNDIEETLIGGI